MVRKHRLEFIYWYEPTVKWYYSNVILFTIRIMVVIRDIKISRKHFENIAEF